MLPNSEWILLVLIAVILLKPEDVPIIVRFLAKFIRQAQSIWKNVVNELDNSTNTSPTQSKSSLKKHPFHVPIPKAKSQPMKD